MAQNMDLDMRRGGAGGAGWESGNPLVHHLPFLLPLLPLHLHNHHHDRRRHVLKSTCIPHQPPRVCVEAANLSPAGPPRSSNRNCLRRPWESSGCLQPVTGHTTACAFAVLLGAQLSEVLAALVGQGLSILLAYET